MTLKVSPRERAAIEKELTRALNIVKALPVSTPCTECIYLERANYCARWKGQVPPEAINDGCAEFDDCPF